MFTIIRPIRLNYLSIGKLTHHNNKRIRLFNTNVTFCRILSPEKPPSHFQDYKNLPLTFDQIEKNMNQNNSIPLNNNSPLTQSTSQSTLTNNPYLVQQHEVKKLSITDLFRMKETRGAVWRLLIFTNLIGLTILGYTYYNSTIENIILKDKLLDAWYIYDQKDISQTIMAIHIAMLKKQLLDVGVVPKPSNIAVETALNQLIFERDEDGRLLIYVNTKYPLFDLVPFHSEYSTSKVAKFKNA